MSTRDRDAPIVILIEQANFNAARLHTLASTALRIERGAGLTLRGLELADEIMAIQANAHALCKRTKELKLTVDTVKQQCIDLGLVTTEDFK